MFKNFLAKNFYQKIIFVAIALSLVFIFLSPINAIDISANDNLNDSVSGATDGSIINLEQGTYTTGVINITVNKEITIASKTPQETIIDLEEKGKIFDISTNGILTLENITILNGKPSSGGTITNNGELILKNCIISNNIIGVYNDAGKISIINCQFINNTAGSFGGAIYITKFTTGIIIENSTFRDNYAGTYGGAIALIGGDLNTIILSNATIKNSIFKNNSAGLDGGAIFNRHFNMTVTNCEFDNNNAVQSGGVIALNDAANTTVTSSNFTNNKAAMGGAIYNYGYIINVIDSNFINNSANGTYGGGAISNVLSRLNVTKSTFNNNNASGTFGGAIANCGGLTNITQSLFNSNIASGGGAIYSLIFRYIPRINISDCNFTNNTDLDGRAVCVYGNGDEIINSSFTQNPLAIFINGNNTKVVNCNISNNTNGISIANSSNNVSITGCNILNNDKGILVSDPAVNITINYNRIFNNTEYDLNTSTPLDIDKNWWGLNNPDMEKIIGAQPNSYFIMNITNTTPLNSNGMKINYTFRLNNNESFDSNLLPFFITNVYSNLVNGSIASFDARKDRIFDANINSRISSIEYTFVTDNQLETINGVIPSTNSSSPQNNSNTSQNKTTSTSNKTNNNKKNQIASHKTIANANMKRTGIPIIGIILFLFSIFGTYYRKSSFKKLKDFYFF